jgi:mannosyltransferase
LEVQKNIFRLGKKFMRNNILLDDVIFSLQKTGGISNYWYNLIMESLENNNIFYFEDHYHSDKNYYRNSLKLPTDFIIEDKSKNPLKIKRYLPVKITRKSFNVFHSSYYRYDIGNIKNVTTLYDFMYEKYFPKYNIRRLIHSFQKYQAIKHSDYIIGISENTLNDMLKHFPEFRDKKKQVVYLGINKDFYPIKIKRKFIKIQNYKLYDNSYFLYFGNRKGYKNFKLLVHAYSALLKNNKDKNIPYLVVAGGGAFSKEEIRLLRENNILSSTKKIEKIDNIELNLLYNYCSGFIYPSLYEGFGLPVIEAMKAGAPVICSNSSSIPEVAGEAAILFDPSDVFALEKSLFELLNNNTRKDLIRSGFIQSGKFSWNKMYRETLKIYNSL